MSRVITLKQTNEPDSWDELVKAYGGHPLQLYGWGEVKAAHGWQVDRVELHEGDTVVAGASLLVKRLPGPFRCLVYIARGPWGQWNDEARKVLERYVRQQYKPVCITVEPDQIEPLAWPGWKRSPNRILLARTAVMDLHRSLDELQADMTKKTRQYIRKSAGEGVEVDKAKNHDDVAECLAIYKATASRAGFALHADSYYYDIFDKLGSDSPVYIAKYQTRAVAFLWPIVTPEVAFELYGGMNEMGQDKRANYHLKWYVVQAMKQQGVHRYDVNGLLNDGVSTFKKGFIPQETMLAGTYEKGMSVWYPVWRYCLPLAKRLVQLMRRLGGK